MKTYYAVIDTNVIVSSLLRKESVPGMIVQRILIGQIVPLLNEEILQEYKEVIRRNKFGFSKEETDFLLTYIEEKAVFLERTSSEELFPDPDDAVFYEIALTGRSNMDAYLVTGNIKHYPIRSYVVTPREMLEIIEKEY